MRLAMEFTGKEFREVAYEIDKIVGNLKPGSDDPVRPEMSDEDRRRLLRATYMETKRMEKGDLADRYLETRGVNEPTYPDTLRFSASMKDGQGGTRPAMVALVGVYGEDRYCSMHRTFLRPDGLGKAEMESPRKLMPGALPDGACVALSDYVAGSPLGIAEGIETALAAARLYEMPVWAALNANMLAKWSPPDGCREVAVFGDNDPKFAGQAAAYSLAHKLAVKGIEVTVHIPEVAGMDWNDVLVRK